MTLEWDSEKASANEVKHGVTFGEAATVFENPLARIFNDEAHSEDERRQGNERTMGKMPSEHEDDLLPEYAFDYGEARPNRFADPARTVVVLDEERSKVFKTPEAVQKALRALLEALPSDSAA